jgi:hypothetical protein
MKNLPSLLTLGTAILAMAISASASIYTDTNTYSSRFSEGITLSEGQSYSDSWNYAATPANETITKIETWFNFSSADNEKEQVKIDIGTGEAPVDFSFLSNVINFGDNKQFSWAFTNNAGLFDDASNGVLSYIVKATNISGVNDFYFSSASVKITTVSNSVPEGGATIALLGLGFLGLVASQRKFRLVR